MPRINRIAFVGLDGRLGTMDPAGRSVNWLTAEGDQCQYPAWSPTGDRIATLGYSEGAVGLYIVEDTPDPLLIRSPYTSSISIPFYFSWSPNGRYLGLLANNAQTGISFYVAHVESLESRLRAVGRPFFWTWTPDSEQLLVHTNRRGNGQLAFIDLNERDGDNLARPGFFQAPALSPDGRQWAFVELDDNGGSWLTIRKGADTRHQLPLLDGALMNWSPVGQHLAYVPTNNGPGRFAGTLCLLDVESGEQVTVGDAPTINFAWSPDGQKLVFLTLSEPHSPNNRARLAKRMTALGLSTAEYVNGKHTNGKHASDGDKLAPRNLFVNLWLVNLSDPTQVMQLGNFEPTTHYTNQYLPFFDQYNLSHRIWSPDSDAVVFSMLKGGVPKIFVSDIDGRAPRQIGEGVMPSWSQQ